MALKLARSTYSLADTYYNPLWKYIAAPFLDYLLASWGDATYRQDFYVRRRSSDGVSESDLLAYVRSPSQRLFVLEGSAGIGKTTILQHTLPDELKLPRYIPVWVDVLREVIEPPASVEKELLRLILGKFERSLAADSKRWETFFLANKLDSTGIARTLLARLTNNGSLTTEERGLFAAMCGDSDRLENARLMTRFIREELGRIPVVIIDNIDQLPTSAVLSVCRIAFSLAEGLHSPSFADPSAEGPPVTAPGSAKVLLAMRPITLSAAQKAVGTVIRGHLKPADISEILRRRLACFLETFPGRVNRGQPMPEERGTATLSGERGETDENEQRQVLMQMSDWLTSQTTDSPFVQAADLLTRLTNSNTRLCLLATAQYVASGHSDWVEIYRAARANDSVRSRLSIRKVKHALFLGARSIYAAEKSWLINLLNDGEPDAAGVLIRPRVLKMVCQRRGAAAGDIMQDANKLFGYSEERLIKTWSFCYERGLLEETAQDEFAVTQAAECYLRTMLADFEYLQHVIMDCFVSNDYLVRCISRDEPKTTRIDRVVKFAWWVRKLEVEDLRRIHDNGLDDLYAHYFDDDLLCNILAACVEQAVNFMFRDIENESGTGGTLESVTQLRSAVSFSTVSAEARHQPVTSVAAGV